MKTVVKVLVWVMFPYIMLGRVAYKYEKNTKKVHPVKAFGYGVIASVLSLIAFMIILGKIIPDSPEVKARHAQETAQEAQQKAAQDAQKAAEKAKKDEHNKLIAQFKEAGANDDQAAYYADSVEKMTTDKDRQDAIQFGLKAAKQTRKIMTTLHGVTVTLAVGTVRLLH
jgi:Na+-transporting methylmalonyl-CoA/oxaloacetate decarboxylase gamma subunit